MWLSDTVGFEELFVVPGPEGAIAHAQLKLGPGVVMLGSAPSAPDPNDPWGVVRHGTYICVGDIDALYARVQTAGANIVRPLRDTEYGSREFAVQDPEGNFWSFGTYDPLAEQ